MPFWNNAQSFQSCDANGSGSRRYERKALTLKVKSTQYFQAIRSRPDRAMIRDGWILRVVEAPEREQIQEDGRIRRWGRIVEAAGRYLRVILLPDGETVHNAFFDRRYKP